MSDYYTYNKVRDKKTGRLGVIMSTSYGSFTDKNGKMCNTRYSVRFGEEEYIDVEYYHTEELEFIDYDFSNIVPNIIELLKTDRYKRIPEMVAKRLDPDYFKEGSVVFFLDDGWIDRNVRSGGVIYQTFRYGPRYPYLIVENEEVVPYYTNYCSNYDYRFELTLIPYSRSLKNKTLREIKKEVDMGNYSKIVVPLSLTRYFDGDAYSILSRYDKEY